MVMISIKNIMFKVILPALLIFSFSACSAQQTGKLNDNQQRVTKNCQTVGLKGKNPCFMGNESKRKICKEYSTGYDYYQSFNATGGLFNGARQSNQCSDWSFHMAGNNCNDNPNFNEAQSCNTINAERSFASFPRVQVTGNGRFGNEDQCLKITAYPGDAVRSDADNVRSEISIKPEIVPDSSYWYAWSLMIPQDFEFDSREKCPSSGYRYSHCIISQFHDAGEGKPCKNKTLPFNLNLKKEGDGFLLAVNYGAICNTDKSTPNHGKFSVQRGIWYDVVMNIKWSTNAESAFLDIRIYSEKSEEPVFQKKITGYANLFTDADGKFIPNILQAGLYTGKNICNPRSIFFDEFSMAEKMCCLKSPSIKCDCK